MKNYYKIQNGLPIEAQGIKAPKGFKEFVEGEEPKELIEARISDNQNRITELKILLSRSDYKFTADYDKKDTDDWNKLKESRQSWRDELRNIT